MAKQIVNIGAAPNDGTGDPLRNAFVKVNDNFDDVYLQRKTVTGTVTASNATPANLNLDGYKSYILLAITLNGEGWVRVYTDDASRSADINRSIGSDPDPTSGVIAEVITDGQQTIKISPAIIGFNYESPVTNNIPVSITRVTPTGTSNYSITLHLIPLEV